MNGSARLSVQWLATQFPQLSNIQPLSRGGQKEVFSAQHLDDGDVVLKMMHPNADIERTKRELMAVAQVASPRVPKILEQGEIQAPTGSLFWFRERRIQGATVRECLSTGAFDSTSLLRLGLHVAETLVAAESANIVHRDVKPDNLLVDQAGEYWLIDFGLARHLGLDSLTATANAFGNVTWGYAPAEQCRNIKLQIDARADLFALGVTLYECATGSNPFRVGARDALEVLRRIETMHLPRLRLSFASANEFADFVAALTQRQRIHRPANAREAYNWIRDICESEGVR